MIKRMACVFLVFPLLFTGCYDSVEVSDELYAIMLGLDQSEQGLKLSLILPVYGGEQGEGQTSAGNGKVISVEADNFYEAMNQMHLKMARGISLLHVKSVVVSEELARAGVSEHLSAVRHHMETRNVMGILFTESSAEEYLSFMNESASGALSQELEQLLFRPRKNLYFPIRTLEDFCREMESDYGQTYGVYCKSTEKEGELYGTALFRGDKLVELLDKYQSACTMMVRGEFEGGTMTAKDMVVDINPRPDITIRTTMKNKIPHIMVLVTLEGGLMKGELPGHPTARDEEIAKQIQGYFLETIKKTQRCGSDVWGFGMKTSKHFSTIPQWEAYDWKQMFPKANIQVKVTFKTVKTEVNQR